MKIRVPDYFKDFKCIASECEDTCCAGWEVVIDDETYEKHYKNAKGEFGEILKSNIISEEGENIFRLKGDDCAFLDENKMCHIYRELGEESLCNVCKQFPRVTEEFGSLSEISLSLSCPEVSRIVFKNSKKIEFVLSENNEGITVDNDIDEMMYMELLDCRELIINILQNREVDIEKRAGIVLQFAYEIQEKIDEEEIEDISNIKKKYMELDFEEINSYKGNHRGKYNSIYEWISVYKELVHINDNDPLGLENAMDCFFGEGKNLDFYIDSQEEFNKFYKGNEYKFEHILVYFVFRYFMKSVYDYDALSKIKTAIVSYLMIKELLVVRWIDNNKELNAGDEVDIIHTYSKDIEHLEENIDALAEVFEGTDIFDFDKILGVLMN